MYFQTSGKNLNTGPFLLLYPCFCSSYTSTYIFIMITVCTSWCTCKTLLWRSNVIPKSNWFNYNMRDKEWIYGKYILWRQPIITDNSIHIHIEKLVSWKLILDHGSTLCGKDPWILYSDICPGPYFRGKTRIKNYNL